MAEFEFKLQAKRNEAINRRDAALAALKQSELACDRENKALESRQAELAAHRQATAREVAALAEPKEVVLSAEELSRREAHARRMERVISEIQDQVRIQAGYLDAADALRKLRLSAVEQAVAEVGALDRLEEKQRIEFKMVQQRREDSDNDEAGAQIWLRANRRED